MTKAQIKAYAEEMIRLVQDGGGTLPIEQRAGIVQQAMMICGKPDDEEAGKPAAEEIGDGYGLELLK